MAKPDSKPHLVSWRSLLSIYLIIPLFMLIMAVDLILWNGQLREKMIANPDDWVAFRLLFVLPHIFAGNFLMADRQYISYYRKSALLPGLLVAIGLYPLLRYTLGAVSFWIVFDVWTIWHAWSQQAGLNRILIKQKMKLYQAWTFGCFLVILAVYTQIYASVSLPKLTSILQQGLIFISVILFLSGFAIAPKEKLSRLMTLANGSLAGFTSLSLFLGYPLFAIMGLRIIHDITAFYIYCVHDLNRNQLKHHNWFHNLISQLPVAAPLRLPLVAFSLAAMVSIYEKENWWIEYLAISFSLFHYYIETIVWRGNHLHRQYARFTD